MQQNMRPITKPDLNSVFESMLPLAKSNPQYINAYLLTGTPEQKLAAAMIKDMPQSQTPPAQTQAPTQTVIDKLAGDPGITSLPVADGMYDEQSMAAGGIVAFSGKDGSDVAYNRALQGSFLGRDSIASMYENSPNAANLVVQAGGYLVDKLTGLRWVRNPYTGELSRASDVVENPNSGKYADMGPMANMQSALPTGLGSIPAPFSALPNAVQEQGIKQNLGNTAAAPVAEAPITRDAQAKPDGGSPMRGYKPTDFSVDEIGANQVIFDPTVYERLKEKPVTAAEEMARYKGLVGEDKGLSALKTRLTGMEEKAAKEEEQAPWMALAKAGFAMAAGKSQFALQNVAEGAGVGISDLAAAKERLAAKEEKRFEIQSRLAQAERAEQVAAAKFGVDSEQHVKAQNRATELAAQQARTTVETTNASNNLAAESANVKNKLTAKELGVTEKHYNDMYNASMLQAENSLKGIEKQSIQQQTAILNNLLDEANMRITKLAGDFTATPEQKTDAEARYNAIQKKLMGLTGVEYTGPAAPAGPRKKPLGSF